MVARLEKEIAMGEVGASEAAPPKVSTSESASSNADGDSTVTKNPPTLLSLAAELRNAIYELVFTDEERKPVKIRRNSHVAIPGLYRVNRQLRAETLPIFYNTTTFQTHADVFIDRFLQRLDRETIASLRSVRLCAACSLGDGKKRLVKLREAFEEKGLKEGVLKLRVWDVTVAGLREERFMCVEETGRYAQFRGGWEKKFDRSPKVVTMSE